MQFPIVLVFLAKLGILTRRPAASQRGATCCWASSSSRSSSRPAATPSARSSWRVRCTRSTSSPSCCSSRGREPGRTESPRRWLTADGRAARVPPRRARGGQHVAIITGLSGAGKTATSKLFEDLGYTVVDNVPSDLLRDLAELVANDPERYDRVAHRARRAVGQRAAGARGRARRAPRPRHRAPDLLPRGQRRGAHPALLRRRATATRSTPTTTASQSAIARERQLLDDVRDDGADDHRHHRTCRFGSCASASCRRSSAQPGPDQLSLQVISFGYKYGVPLEADLVFDVRFMENPFYRPELRELLRACTRAGPRLRARPAHHASGSSSTSTSSSPSPSPPTSPRARPA